MKTPPVSGRRSLCVDRKNGEVNVLLSERKGTRLQGQKGSRAVGDGVLDVPFPPQGVGDGVHDVPLRPVFPRRV